jgi:hypothetical protein
MVRLHRPLRFLPTVLVEALSRVCFHWIRGVDEVHDRRWRRLLSNLFHTRDAAPVLQFYPVVDRSGRFHKRHMAIEGRIYENQDGFLQREAFRIWLKTGACWGHYEAFNGALVFVPNSCSYEDASDDEMREFHEDAIAYLRTPHALAVLWPAVVPERRLEMLETLLRDPEEQTE